MKHPAPKITSEIASKKSDIERARETLEKAAVLSKKIRLRLKAPRFMDVVDDKKNDTPLKRLCQFLEIVHENDVAKSIREVPERLLETMKREQPDKGWRESNFELANHEVFYRYASAALTLDAKSGVDDPLLTAFEKAKLNPVDPLHWRVLMTVLCWALFPPKGSAGPPTYWTDDRYCQLLREIHKFKSGRRRTHSDNEACEMLSKARSSDGRESYLFENDEGPLSSEALRRALQQARDPKHNGTLAHLVNRGLRMFEEDYTRRGHIWPPLDLERLLARVRDTSRIETRDPKAATPGVVEPPRDFAENGAQEHFLLLQDWRASNHRDLLKVLGTARLGTYNFETFLEDRRTNDCDAVREALVAVKDYDSFLKVLEDVVKADQDALLHAFISEYGGSDICAFVDALHCPRKEDLEAVSRALTEYYCEQISLDRTLNELDHPGLAQH